MKLKVTCAALSALTLGALSAHAQVLPAGDIAVGFFTASAGSNVEVDAGSVSTLQGDTTQTLIGNYNTGLTSLSTNWATLTSGTSALSWGSVGQVDTNSAYLSFKWSTTTPGTLGTSNSAGWTNQAPFMASNNTKIGALYPAFANGTATGTGASGITIATSTNGAWTNAAAGGASGQFATGSSNLNAVAGKLASGANYSAIDLYLVSGSTSTEIGTFALYSSNGGGFSKGDLTFTAAPSAIPEPSTYAAILGVATLGLIMARRRSRAVLA